MASDRHRVTLHFHGHSVPARIDCVQSSEEARIDAAIDAWHESDTGLELHEYLGMTEEQYAAFVERCEVPRAPVAPGATETAVRDGSATLGGSPPKTRQEPAQAQESVSSHMATYITSREQADALLGQPHGSALWREFEKQKVAEDALPVFRVPDETSEQSTETVSEIVKVICLKG